MAKFSVQKAKASTKKSIKGKLPKGTAGGKRNTRTNPNSMRSDKRNASPIEESGDNVLKGEAMDPNAMRYDYNEETGNITERRMTRKEELQEILDRSSSPFRSPRNVIRRDKKAYNE